MCLAGCANDEQPGPASPGQRSPSPPTELPTISQAAFQILENILPHRVIESLASPTTEANDADEAPASPAPVAQDQNVLQPSIEYIKRRLSTDSEDGGHFAYLLSVSRLPLADERSSRAASNAQQSRTSSPSITGDIRTVLSTLKEELNRHRIPSASRDIANHLDKLAGLDQAYLISKNDIGDILTKTIKSLQGNEGPSDEHAPDETLLRQQRPSLPRPNLHKIQPTPAAVADPATSISLPRTSFAVASPDDSQIHTKTRQLDRQSTTTIVSRKSISRITWAPDILPEAPGPRNEPSLGPQEQIASVATITTLETGSGHARDILYGMGSSAPFVVEHSETGVGGSKRCENSMFSNEEDAHITSFPELRSRHCTNEWLNPPPELNKTVEVAEDDLYIQRVDAHCGNPSRISVIVLEGDPPKPRHCNHELFGENPFCKATECSTGLPVARSPRPSVAEKRLGASIGTSAHRRRSSQFVAQHPHSAAEDQDNALPSIMEKIRRSGRKIFKHRGHKSSDQRSGEFATPYNSPDELQARSAIRSRDSIVKERTLEPPQVDHAGIYEALTGSRLVIPGRRGTCSEDNRPHVCEDDLSSVPSPIPSPMIPQ